jgi:hypothetical protein
MLTLRLQCCCEWVHGRTRAADATTQKAWRGLLLKLLRRPALLHTCASLLCSFATFSTKSWRSYSEVTCWKQLKYCG